jgi:hypothetical protein
MPLSPLVCPFYVTVLQEGNNFTSVGKVVCRNNSALNFGGAVFQTSYQSTVVYNSEFHFNMVLAGEWIHRFVHRKAEAAAGLGFLEP